MHAFCSSLIFITLTRNLKITPLSGLYSSTFVIYSDDSLDDSLAI